MQKYIASVEDDDKWLLVGTLSDAIGAIEASPNYRCDAFLDDALGDLRFVRDRLTELFAKQA